MSTIVNDIAAEFRKHKSLADRAMAVLSDDEFTRRPGDAVNPVALIVKHLAGNLTSRWTDFLSADGEKPTRNRDGEFELGDADTRADLMAAWERGWQTLFDALARLTADDLSRTVYIRGEPMTAQVALLRAVTHAAYHVGQITHLARMMRPDAPWLTLPLKGRSASAAAKRGNAKVVT
jgi:uncharacterized damage-inducible protein DinB